jgi:DNA-binding NtrC family response regulator
MRNSGPSRHEPSAGSQEAHKPCDGRRCCRILLIEDDHAVAATLTEMLHELGHQVVAVKHCRTAAAAAAATLEVDLAILDLDVGGRPTFGIADQLTDRGIAVAFTTGYGISSLYGKYRHAALLLKPFSIQSVARLVDGAEQTTWSRRDE